MQVSSITSKGQVTIPAEIRKSLHLATGQKVKFSCKNNVITIVPIEKDISSAFGLLKLDVPVLMIRKIEKKQVS